MHTPLPSSRRTGVDLRLAALVAVAVSGVGGLYDLITGQSLRRAFDVCLVIGCALAAVLVRKDRLGSVVFLPPLVYLLVALVSSAPALVEGGGVRAVVVREGIALFSALVLNAPALLAATGITLVIAVARWLAGRR